MVDDLSKFEYSVTVRYRGADYDLLAEWCQQHYGEEWVRWYADSVHVAARRLFVTFWFSNRNDAVLFELTFYD